METYKPSCVRMLILEATSSCLSTEVTLRRLVANATEVPSRDVSIPAISALTILNQRLLLYGTHLVIFRLSCSSCIIIGKCVDLSRGLLVATAPTVHHVIGGTTLVILKDLFYLNVTLLLLIVVLPLEHDLLRPREKFLLRFFNIQLLLLLLLSIVVEKVLKTSHSTSKGKTTLIFIGGLTSIPEAAHSWRR